MCWIVDILLNSTRPCSEVLYYRIERKLIQLETSARGGTPIHVGTCMADTSHKHIKMCLFFEMVKLSLRRLFI